MTITFILHLIMTCAFLVVSLALSFKFIVEAVLEYKQVTKGIQVITERDMREAEDKEDGSTGW